MCVSVKGSATETERDRYRETRGRDREREKQRERDIGEKREQKGGSGRAKRGVLKS